MRKALCVIFVVILTLAMFGCAKIIDTETKVVEATIIEVDRDPMMLVGKVIHPADYDIRLQYEDITAWIDVSRSEYEKYKDLVSATIEVNFVVDYYDDGTVKRYLRLIDRKEE